MDSPVTEVTANELENWGWIPIRESMQMLLLVLCVEKLCGLVRIYINVSEEDSASIFRAEAHMALEPGRPTSTSSLTWERKTQTR
jgi:hypothetical protein